MKPFVVRYSDKKYGRGVVRRFNSEQAAHDWIKNLRAPRASKIRDEGGYVVEPVKDKTSRFIYSKKDVDSFIFEEDPDPKKKPVLHYLYVSWPLRVKTIIEDTADVEKRLKGIVDSCLGAGAGFGMRDIDFTIDRRKIPEARAALADLKLVTVKDGGPYVELKPSKPKVKRVK